MRTHLDLFSGIGGFSLAAQWAGFQTIAFCEIEPYAQQVLIEKFGAVLADATVKRQRESQDKANAGRTGRSPRLESEISSHPILHPDIFALDGAQYRGVTLVTGGFPCQPFSCAGKRRGKEDDRHLWPEMHRVIAEARPAFVLAENVPGIIGMELDNCLSDLEAIGYACGTLVVPACAVDARHRRDRIWIMACRDNQVNVTERQGELQRPEQRAGNQGGMESVRQGDDVADSDQQGPQGRDGSELRECSGQWVAGEGDSSMANPQRDDNGGTNGTGRGQREQEQVEGDGMREDGYWLPEPAVGRTLDGLSAWLDENRGLTMQSHNRIMVYAKIERQSSAEVLQILRSGIESEDVRIEAGGQGRVSPSQVLLAYLCQLQKEAGTLGDVSLESQEASGEGVRSLRNSDKPSGPPYRPRSKKQQGVKHPDSLHSLSSVLAFHAEQAWGAYRFQDAQAILNPWRDGWEDGFRRVASGIPARTHRLRALGNAIVPQVAYQILKALP